MTPLLSPAFSTVFLPLVAGFGILFALAQLARLTAVSVPSVSFSSAEGENAALDEDLLGPIAQHDDIARSAAFIAQRISTGARSYLRRQGLRISYFFTALSLCLFFLLSSGDKFSTHWREPATPDGPRRAPVLLGGALTVVAFCIGGLTSLAAGWAGMQIGCYSNIRCAAEARRGVRRAFAAAYRGGAAISFLVTSFGLLSLYTLICLFLMAFRDDWGGAFSSICGFGLGASSVALFARVGGGIYTKAADVGADLVGKVLEDLPEDDPRNPAVVADLVGDLVGDVAGMSADLFGSFAEASVSALVLSSVSSIGASRNWTAILYPLHLSAVSILVCALVTVFGTDMFSPRVREHIAPTLKGQVLASTSLMAAAALPLTLAALPRHITGVFAGDPGRAVSHWSVYACLCSGLVAGLITGGVTEVFTSSAFSPVREVAEANTSGAATSIILGLALGYKSAVAPVLLVASSLLISFQLSGFYGISIAALGVLGTLSTTLAIDAFGPITDNAGGIAEMSHMGEDVREITDALDAAGNTTAAVGKGFAIGSAALVGAALFGSYCTAAGLHPAEASLLDAKTLSFVVVGAVLPYAFSGSCLGGVGRAAVVLVDEVKRQFRDIPGLRGGEVAPDSDRCVDMCSAAALREMVLPGAIAIFSPALTGVFMGVRPLAGLLVGILSSGMPMAISAACSGGAWDNSKKHIEAGGGNLGGKGSPAHKNAVVCDVVGDPLKDTSGPALNILIKLSAVLALVLAPFLGRGVTREGLLLHWLRW